MAAISGHGGDVARLHDHAGQRLAGVLVGAVPLDLVAHLKEPFHAVVGVQNGQDVLFSRRAHVAVLDHAGERRIPRDLRAAQEGEQVEGVHLVLEPRLWMQFRLVLRHIGKAAIDRRAACIAAQREVVLQPHAAFGQLTGARHRCRVVAMLAAVGRAGFQRRGKRVKAFVGPVVQHLLEDRADLVHRKVLQQIDA
ncbi:hypothetical protein SDC9_97604 [bioreactor metagenome]|uniref:Uncharacterized protein n=1 Tax=bioreactor metagenome TaxID=1076179 RepID=A0A645ADT6_9ZZZZ